jgi:hypothetical protein
VYLGFLARSKFDPTQLNPRAEELLQPLREVEFSTNTDEWKQMQCPVCINKSGAFFTAIGETAWKSHLESRMHKGQIRRRRKIEEYEAWKQRSKCDSETVEPQEG